MLAALIIVWPSTDRPAPARADALPPDATLANEPTAGLGPVVPLATDAWILTDVVVTATRCPTGDNPGTTTRAKVFGVRNASARGATSFPTNEFTDGRDPRLCRPREPRALWGSQRRV
ncbi:MAG: hypothetical protein KatS3mg060_0442 [Dehalococcoidia bacterium]|nr:MAG: hypothetical protein KatS3mg060_0442 [Dehalococcoidia bacterium]